jgi:hypothetical protein
MESMLGVSLYSYPYLKLAKDSVFLIIVYVFSSTKSEKRAEQESWRIREEKVMGVGRKGRRWEAGRRNDPNNVCTYT